MKQMKQITQTILITLASVFATTIVFAEDVERTVDASADGNVSISNIAGSVEVAGWSKKQVEVIADLGRDVEELIVERDGDRVIIKVKVPKRNSRNISSILTVRVPENSSIEVSGVSADVDVEDVLGEMSLQTVSGDVNSEIFGSDVEVETVSGDIGFQGNNQEMQTGASTVSGDIEATNLKGDIEVESVSGDIVFVGGSFQRAEAGTVNGDIDLAMELQKEGRLQVETINGDVDINFKGPVSARFDIETFNGEIDNCFGPDPERTSRYAPGRELNFSEGDGDGRVEIETLNGGISFCRD